MTVAGQKGVSGVLVRQERSAGRRGQRLLLRLVSDWRFGQQAVILTFGKRGLWKRGMDHVARIFLIMSEGVRFELLPASF